MVYKMSVNIFGSQQNYRESNKQHFNSKFIALSRVLQTKLNKSGDTIEGELNMNNNKIVNLSNPLSDSDVANKQYVDNKIEESENDITEMLNGKVNTNGDVMFGDLDMHGNRITRLEDPIHNLHAANKIYVDEAIRVLKTQLHTLSTIGL